MTRQTEDKSQYDNAERFIDPRLLLLNENNSAIDSQTAQEDPLFMEWTDAHNPDDLTVPGSPTLTQTTSQNVFAMESQGGLGYEAFPEEGKSSFVDHLQPGKYQFEHQDPTTTAYKPISLVNISETSFNTLEPSVICQPMSGPYIAATAALPEVDAHPSQAQAGHAIPSAAFLAPSISLHPASGAACHGQIIASQRDQDYLQSVRLKSLWAYDPLNVAVCRSRNIFIPSEHLDLHMSVCDQVTYTEAIQDDILGKRFTIAETSYCSGVNGARCRCYNSRLLHQWKLDNEKGILVTAIRAACKSCKPEKMHPTPICAKIIGVSRNSRCDTLGVCSTTGSNRSAYCQAHMVSRRHKSNVSRQPSRREHSSSQVQDHQDSDGPGEDVGVVGCKALGDSPVSLAACPSQGYVSEKRLEMYRKQRIQALCAYDPSEMSRTRNSSSIFVPSTFLRLNLNLCSNVALTHATQNQIAGQELMIVDKSRLLHQWRIDNKHGVWITAVRAACGTCQSEEVYPMPICGITDSLGDSCCDVWPCRHNRRKSSATKGYCQVHWDEVKEQKATRQKKRKLDGLQDPSMANHTTKKSHHRHTESHGGNK